MGRGHREWERARRSDELSDTVPIEGGGRGGEGAGPLLRERVGEVEGAIDGGEGDLLGLGPLATRSCRLQVLVM